MICDLAFGSLYFHTELLIQKITCSLFLRLNSGIWLLAAGFSAKFFSTQVSSVHFQGWVVCFFWAHSQAMRKR
jgi:hypothetical protein